ncbi:hypothetical protein AWQ24_11460 [Picosynechococcus sp. PCC 8807]|nr:hypothetical protein AWQ24_11460 [Picosynechococcus sp. PCC 8807]
MQPNPPLLLIRYFGLTNSVYRNQKTVYAMNFLFKIHYKGESSRPSGKMPTQLAQKTVER